MPDAHIHLICGGVGSGKTTFSAELADGLGGVALSIDEWMVELFGADAPQPLDMVWLAPRVARCERQIWKLAVRLARLSLPVVLDLGFQTADQRARYRELATAAGLVTQTHCLDVPRDERWSRVEARNNRQDGTFQLIVTRPMFDFMEQRWEPPHPDELALA